MIPQLSMTLSRSCSCWLKVNICTPRKFEGGGHRLTVHHWGPCPLSSPGLAPVSAEPQGLDRCLEMAQLSRSYGAMVTLMLFRSVVQGEDTAFAFKWRFGSL